MYSGLLLLQNRRPKCEGLKTNCRELGFDILERERERERECLLSKIPGDRTFGFLRTKKESRSTRRGQRVGTGFLEFRQTP